MAKKGKKSGGRVTPKGTQSQPKSKKGRRRPEVPGQDVPEPDVPASGHLPERVRHEHGRATRPITHNRGNR